MNLRRCFCCLLACVFCFSAVSLTSVYATEVDGYSVYTYYSVDGNYYTNYETTISLDAILDTLYIKATIYFPEPLASGIVFDMVLDLDYSTNASIEAVCNLYADNNDFISTEIPQISVVDDDTTGGTNKSLKLYDILVPNGDLSYMVIYFTITEPYLFESTIYETYNFTIDGTSYSCTEGYTWEVFAESTNNDGTISIDPYGRVMSSVSDNYVYKDGTIVLGSDYIIDGQAYWLTTDNTNYQQVKTFMYYYQAGSTGSVIPYTYNYLDGMTWAEWLASDYNTDGWAKAQISSTTTVVIDHNVTKICSDANTYVNVNSTINQPLYATYAYWNSQATASLANTDYKYFFSVTGVTVTIDEGDELLGGIIGWIKNVFNSVVDLPGKIAGHLKGFFDSVVNAITHLGDYLLDGIKSLFVPDAEELSEYKDKWEQLLKDRFGAVYESVDLIDAWANAFMNTPAQIPSSGGAGGNSEQLAQEGQIWFPRLTVDLAGSEFTFGGYAVDIIPSGFSGVVDTLKLIVNICASFLFVNALRKRLEGVLH